MREHDIKKGNFYEYLEELNEIYKASRGQYEALHNDFTAKDEGRASIEEDGSRSESERQIAHWERIRNREQYKQDYKNMLAAYNISVKELRGRLMNHLKAFYTATPEAIDEKTMTFLNSRIADIDELRRLVNVNWDNVTMLRILDKYIDGFSADRYDQETRDKALLAQRAISERCNGEKPLDTFVSMSEYGSKGLSEYKGSADAFNARWDELYNTTLDEAGGEPPEGWDTPDNGAGKYATVDEIMSMRDSFKRQAAIANNMELFHPGKVGQKEFSYKGFEADSGTQE